VVGLFGTRPLPMHHLLEQLPEQAFRRGGLAMDGYFASRLHHQLRDRVREFAETEVRPRIPAMETARSVHRELSRLIARQGWLGATISKEHGGMGVGHLAKTIIIEELSRVSGAMGAMVQASQLGTAKIIHCGNERQKKTWLPAIAAGRCLPTIAVTEAESGSHGMSTATRPPMSAASAAITTIFSMAPRRITASRLHQTSRPETGVRT